MTCRIIQSHQPQFARAPQVGTGGWVVFEHLDPNNTAWFFGRDERGVAGYFPVDWFVIEGSNAQAKRDYDASELAVNERDWVEVLERFGRWIHVRTADGARGWIPDETVDAGPADPR